MLYSTANLLRAQILATSVLLSACAGPAGTPPNSSPANTPQQLSEQQRSRAALETATANSDCKAIQPFYWEIGDRNSMRTGGTAGGTNPTSATSMKIASASKWVFGAYVVQL